MNMTNTLISIGFNKDGEADFAISDMASLSIEKMNQLRAMITVAIGTAEMMWRNTREKDASHQVSINKD